MLGLWANKREGPAISADFKHALMRQVLRTELIRIKALIGTTVLLGSLILIIHAVDPNAIDETQGGAKSMDYRHASSSILHKAECAGFVLIEMRTGQRVPHFRLEILADIQDSAAFRTEHPFVAVSCKCINLRVFHVQREGSQALDRIDEEEAAATPADLAYCF